MWQTTHRSGWIVFECDESDHSWYDCQSELENQQISELLLEGLVGGVGVNKSIRKLVSD